MDTIQKPCDSVGYTELDKYQNSISNIKPQYEIKKHSVSWVLERTVPTERLQLVGEASAMFCGKKGVITAGPLRPQFRFSG
jgi:hypothetical protein